VNLTNRSQLKQQIIFSVLSTTLFTGCGAFDFVFTGSSTGKNPIQLVFLQNKGTGFELNLTTVKANDGISSDTPIFDNTKLRTFPLSGGIGKIPISLASSNQGNQIYITFQDRIQIISRETLGTSPLDKITIDPIRDQEWVANLDQATNCIFQSSQVSSDNRWISALVQCNSANDPAGQQIWVYSIEQGKEWLRINNPTPKNQNIETLNKQGFPYAISGNILYFIKPNSQDNTQSNLYNFNLSNQPSSIITDLPFKTLEGIYSLGLVENSAVALTDAGVKNFTTTNDLGPLILGLTKATRVWSNGNRAGFWDSSTNSNTDSRIQFKNSQYSNKSNAFFNSIQDMVFSNDDYAWILNPNSLIRFDVSIIKPNIAINTASLDYNSAGWNFTKTPPIAMAWLLGATQP
jgi:hypothetical protein